MATVEQRPVEFAKSDRLIAERLGVSVEDLPRLCEDPAFARLVHDTGNQLTIEIATRHLTELRQRKGEAE